MRKMPTLFLTCQSCHEEFPTPIGVTDPALTGVIISGMPHRCPACGVEGRYSTQDYHVPRETLKEVEHEENRAIEDRDHEVEAKQHVDTVRLAGYGVKPENGPPPTAV